MNNGTQALRTVMHLAKQVWRGIPYVQKEVGRALSVRTGRVFATPQMYYVAFGGRCNTACTFCTYHQKVEPMLPGEVMLRIVREARELSGIGFNISLSGGEPLIYPPLYDVLELAHQLKVNFGITTNGYLLTRQNVARALQLNIFNINVSIESVTPQVNEAVRPRKNGTEQTLEGIDNLVAEKRRTGARVSIIVKTTIMDQNYRTLPELVQYLHRYPEVQVSFQPYLGPVERGFWIRDLRAFERVVAELKDFRKSGSRLMVDDKTLDGFVRYFQHPPKTQELSRLDLEGRKRGCDIGYRSMEIFPNGSVQFCNLLKRDIGNVHQQSLKDIYYGAVANRLRQRIDYCDIDCQRTCQRAIPISTKVRAFVRMG